MTPRTSDYQPQTAAETITTIAAGTDPWLAFGQFVDDWERTERLRRGGLVEETPPPVSEPWVRWAALLSGAVEWLCARDGLPTPAWTRRAEYRLRDPWFLYPGWRLRAWQLFETPAAFRVRNIFGGDRILSRV